MVSAGGSTLASRIAKSAVLTTILVALLTTGFVGATLSYTPPPKPPPSPAASVVIGQPDFNSSNQGSGMAQFGFPEYATVDNSGNLWVSDYQNGWVTEYTPPFSNGQSSVLEIGAESFSSGPCNTGNAICQPGAIAFDPSGNLWVADQGNASVSEFKTPFSLGESSSVLLGGYYLDHPPNATNFGPAGLAFDSSGNLWVLDGSHSRILEFTPPFSSREAASLVIGQSDFSSSSNSNNQSKLSEPDALTFDHSGNLWVADTFDNRVLEFKAPFANGESASISIGQPNLQSTSENTTQSTLNGPEGLAFDTYGNLWVSDTSNNRVLEFVSPFSTGMNATVVIGQDYYWASGLGTSQTELYGPQGLAAGPNGNLWVVDTENYRVLLFTDPASAAGASTSSLSLPSTTSTTTQQTSSQAQQTTLSSKATVTSSSSSSSGGVPEFPYQLPLAAVFTLLLAGVYLFARRRNNLQV